MQQPAVLLSLLEKMEQLEQHMKTLTLQPHNQFSQQFNERTFPSAWPSHRSHGFQHEVTKRASRSTGKVELHDSGSNTLALFKRLSCLKRFVEVALQVSLKITVGAGGSSIMRSLLFHATVADDSPAFALFRHPWALRQGKGIARIEDLHHDLFELFRSGKASPLDKLAAGETLLHVSFDLIYPVYYDCTRRLGFSFGF
jgi:hypothetical protein